MVSSFHIFLDLLAASDRENHSGGNYFGICGSVLIFFFCVSVLLLSANKYWFLQDSVLGQHFILLLGQSLSAMVPGTAGV